MTETQSRNWTWRTKRTGQLTQVGSGAEMQKADNIPSEGNQLHRVTAGGDKISMALGTHPEGSALSQLVSALAGKASALANTGCATQPCASDNKRWSSVPSTWTCCQPQEADPLPRFQLRSLHLTLPDQVDMGFLHDLQPGQQGL